MRVAARRVISPAHGTRSRGTAPTLENCQSSDPMRAFRLPVLLLLAAPAAAQHVSPPPHEAGGGAMCTALGTDSVCRTPVENADGPTGVGRMMRGDVSWDVGWGAVASDFRLIDLGPMRAVAALGAISNGLGVNSWTIDLVPDRSGAPVASFDAQEFTPDGRSAETRDGQTIFWATEWWTGPDPSGRRGPGTYLIGRPFAVTESGLVPATRFAIHARRLLYDFRAEHGGPVRWLRDRRAEAWRSDPLLNGAPETTRGTVTAATLVSEHETGPVVTMTVRTEAGGDLVLSSDVWGDGPAFAHVGDAATGRLWPSGYRPGDVAEWLVGHRVRVETRGGSPAVLWRE